MTAIYPLVSAQLRTVAFRGNGIIAQHQLLLSFNTIDALL
jgi:hypothetical protein